MHYIRVACVRALKAFTSYFRSIAFAILATLISLWAIQANAQIRYYYDELGRLVEAVAPDGQSAQYTYDALGNILSINRVGSTTVSISEFTPNGGPVGTTVTIYGSGYSSIPANNTVQFNGTAAAVSAATATSLIVTVPAGATSGAISVSNSNGSATSGSSFVVLASTLSPLITSFTPDVGTTGTVVSITGGGFQLNAQQNKVTFGGVPAAVLMDSGSPTVNFLKVAAAAASGRIQVTTPFGEATSTADFYSLPSSVSAADVEFKGRLAVDGAAVNVVTTMPGKKAVLLFDGATGQKLKLLSSEGTFASTLAISVYAPDGRLAASNLSLGSPGIATFFDRLSGGISTGTYTIILTPQSTDKGTMSVSLTSDSTDIAGALTVDGSTAVSLSAGRFGHYSFTAEAGKGYGLALTGLSFTPTGGAVMARLRTVRGNLLATCAFGANGSCEFEAPHFASAGTYFVDFEPNVYAAAAFNAILSKDTGGELTVGASAATTVPIALEGQNGRYTFGGLAGQEVSVVFTENMLDDGNASTSNSTYVKVYRPSNGSSIGYVTIPTGTAGATLGLTLPETGIYTVFVDPRGLDKGSIRIQVQGKLYTTGALAVDGSTAVNLSTGWAGRYSFTAEAAKGYGLAVTGLSFTPTGGSVNAMLLTAAGTWLATCSFTASASCNFDPSYFASAGTYLVDFEPNGAYATAFNAVLSKDTGGELTVDAAAATTAVISREGQNGRYTFSGTAGQAVSVVLTGNTLDDGNTGTNNSTNLRVYRPSNGSQVASTTITTNTAGRTLAVTLPETGVHTVLLDPVGLDKGSINVQVKSYATGDLTVDGSTAADLSTGRFGRYSFTAEAGKGYGLALTGLSFTPTGGTLVARLRTAAGTSLVTCSFTASGSCNFLPSSFATAGTYLVDFEPSGAYATAFNAVLSKDTGGELTVDAAAATTMTIAREGQNGRYTFSGTAGDLVNIVISNMVGISNTTFVQLYRPSDGAAVTAINIFSGQGGALSATLPQTGVYSFLVDPSGLDTGSIDVQVKSYATGPLTVDGITPVNLSAGRTGRYSFTAEAGKGYGLALPGYTITPANTLFVTLRNATGTALSNCNIYNGTSTCTFAPSLFASAGTYMIDFVPGGASAATFNASFSKDTGGELTVDAAAATTTTIAREGQNGRYTFSGTAGVAVSVLLTANMLSDGNSATNNATFVQLYRPSDGAAIGAINVYSNQAGGTLSATLPQTGVYTLLVDPGGLDKGSIDVRVIHN